MYAPEIDKRCRPHLKPTNDSWRVDETYILRQRTVEVFVSSGRFRGQHFGLSALVRNAMRSSAEQFLRKTLNASHTQSPRVINVDKNAAYPAAVEDLKADEQLPETTELRLVLYLNNRVEQEHRFPCATNKARDGIWFIQQGTGVPSEGWKR